jgi:UDP-glucose 4-epimerase
LPYEELDKVNNLMAIDLAKHAAESGVNRFVFVSTINVVAGNKPPLTPEMDYNPLNDYGRSKARAEQSLMQLKGIEIVIARPSLVYGPNAPGNLAALMRLCKSGIPLPFGCATNRRSFLSITNAIRALEFLATAEADKVAAKIFHLAEPIPRSTAEIIAECRAARNRSARLVPIPKFALRFLLSLLGKRAAYEQLFGDLEVDSTSLVAAGFRFVDGQPDMHAMAFASG